MAVTFIYPIKVTGENSLNYDTENKNAKIVNEKNDSKESLEYVMRDKKGNTYKLSSEYLDKMKNYISYDKTGNVIFHTIKTGINCSLKNAYQEWEMVRKALDKRRGQDGNLQYCIVQNFGTDLDPMIANEIGVRFAREYLSDFQCVVSTHINTGFVHNHIEFNATSFVDGHKFNRCTQATRDIRKISDKLCDEYGLEVLEATRDMKIVKGKTQDGKTVYYEPTDRKNQIVEGEFANKNEYRNTEQYKQSQKYAMSHIEELKKDIDRLLPYSVSYEDLLQQLQNVGYEIRDKTKNGEWRKHISFKAQAWDKFTRDSSLGEEYEREFLTNIISDNVKNNKVQTEPENSNEQIISDSVKKSDIYVYGRIIIEDIDEEYRYRKKKKGEYTKNDNAYEKVKRSDIEKYIIVDTKKLNNEVNAIMRQAMYPKRERIQELSDGTKKQQYLIDRINGNLRTLKFVEDKEIRSFGQMNDIVKTLCEKRNACYEQMNLIGEALKKANANIVLIDKYNSLKEVISSNENNPDYILYEQENDMALLKTYENALRQKGLLSKEKQDEFKSKYNKYNTTFLQLSKALEKVNRDIRQYDDCIFNISVVDRDNGNRYASQIKTYYEIKKENKNNSQPQQEKNNERE